MYILNFNVADSGGGCACVQRANRARRQLGRGPKGCRWAIRANALIDGAGMHQNESSAGSSMPREGSEGVRMRHPSQRAH
jgi:hypothetical protein